ncbi:MAG TPA: type II secretion system protein [Sedimentisphaerales bacterium]|nr:type II secretion system protein [Sedimentisphaerales bacterium]
MYRRKSGFTLIELLVVISIIALLMALLMPALQRVKKQARTVACLSLLRQWSLWFSMYAMDNGGYLMEGWQGSSKGTGNNTWCSALGAYHNYDTGVTCCPNATKPWLDEFGNSGEFEGTFLGSTTAWGYWKHEEWLQPLKGSYAMNGWCNNPEPGYGLAGKSEADHWRTPDVQGAGYVPLFLGAQRYDTWPRDKEEPPEYDGQQRGSNHMRRVCVNRHNGFVNTLFLDWSARRVGLKELWVLKWHRSYDTAGVWTRAGNALPSDWPIWLRDFKDY